MSDEITVTVSVMVSAGNEMLFRKTRETTATKLTRPPSEIIKRDGDILARQFAETVQQWKGNGS